MAEHKKQANMNVFQLPFYELKKWRNSVSRVTIVVMHVVLHTFFLFIQARRTREWAVKMIIATRVRCRGKLCVCFFVRARKTVSTHSGASESAFDSQVVVARFHIYTPRSWRAIFAVRDTERAAITVIIISIFPGWCWPHQTAHAIIMCK
jgi:hypothetical protein